MLEWTIPRVKMLCVKKKNQTLWTRAKQNPPCTLKTCAREIAAPFEALEISTSSYTSLCVIRWRLQNAILICEEWACHDFRSFLLWNIEVCEHIARLPRSVHLLQFIQFREAKRNEREVELTQGNYTDMWMTASECLVWNFSWRFMQIPQGGSISTLLALHIVKPSCLSSWQQLLSHLLYLGNRSATGFSSTPGWLFSCPIQILSWGYFY